MKENVKQNEIKKSKKIALHYMVTLADVAREPFLILDRKLRVILANQTFYQSFRVLPKETENKLLYQLGNGQWNIPELKRLMEQILPDKKSVRDYKVKHNFQTIGTKIMLLNAQQIDSLQLIILAMEDITVEEKLRERLADYTKKIEIQVDERTAELARRIKELESINKSMVGRELKMVELKKEIENLKKRVKNGNGKNGKKKNGNHKNGKSNFGKGQQK